MLEEDQLDNPRPFTISLDFDDTYTLDPKFWNKFICNAEKRGHRVIIVT